MSLSPLPKKCTDNIVLIKQNIYIGTYDLPLYIYMCVCMYISVYMQCLQYDASHTCYGQAGKK